MRVDVLTIFPGMFAPILGESILRIAREKGCLDARVHDIRDWSTDKHHKVDDRPFGGGPGMVMKAQPVADAVEAIRAEADPPGRLIFLTPDGERFDQARARSLAREERLVLVCGRYEGFDERLFDALAPERLSIGDYILTGGELAALVVIDAVTRLQPGVLGCPESAEAESFEGAGLDHPHYTQPAVWRGREVPAVLRSGDHARVDAWRREEALRRTRLRRPDLLTEDNAQPGENEERGT
ncbi:MAG: tRNA (guanosine(37)-N1)-methyltransferase TrmD [Planctomycetota bacterium]